MIHIYDSSLPEIECWSISMRFDIYLLLGGTTAMEELAELTVLSELSPLDITQIKHEIGIPEGLCKENLILKLVYSFKNLR